MIFLIFIGADLMNSALALTQIPAQLATLVKSMGLSPLLVVTAILLLYGALGCIMDELSILLLTIPIFFPMIIGLDFGMPRESVAIWFGIMVLIVCVSLQAIRWQEQRLEPDISFNLSPAQLWQPDLIANVVARLAGPAAGSRWARPGRRLLR